MWLGGVGFTRSRILQIQPGCGKKDTMIPFHAIWVVCWYNMREFPTASSPNQFGLIPQIIALAQDTTGRGNRILQQDQNMKIHANPTESKNSKTL